MDSYDTFLSYAYVDNAPVPPVPQGWVDTFVKILKIRLAQKLGREGRFRLWEDRHRVPGNVQIQPEIEQAIRLSSTLLVILSRGYLESPWCRLELETFLKLHPDASSRMFVVYRGRLEAGQRPPAFEGVRGYQFWEEGKGRSIRIWGDPVPDPMHDADYYSLIDDLSQDMADLLDSLKARGPATDSTNGSGAAQAPVLKVTPAPTSVPMVAPIPDEILGTVFLAQTTDDMIATRNSVRRHLQGVKVRILPETWYSHDPDTFAQSAKADLARCDVFVQLLGEVAGSRSPDLPHGFNGLQHELALRSGKPILQWRPSTLDPSIIEEEDHRQLLEGETVIACGIEDFKKMIVDRMATLKAPAPEPRPKVKDGAGQNTLVFVDAEKADFSLARIVGKVLEQESVGCILPLETGTPAEVSQDIEDSLTLCDMLVIVYGKIHALWVRQHLRWMLKVMPQRQRPLRAVALLRIPPPPHEKREDLRLNLPSLRVLDCLNGLFREEDHDLLVQEVRQLLVPLMLPAS
jgi:hypothetical protein